MILTPFREVIASCLGIKSVLRLLTKCDTCRVFEKLRCEKRLLEDKYRTLKDKYVRLKGDVKMSVERRRKREHTANTTGSETERSTSHRATDR